MADLYMNLTYDEYKSLEAQIKDYKETFHTSMSKDNRQFYHKSLVFHVAGLRLEFHGPNVGAQRSEEDSTFPVTEDHTIHYHNDMNRCTNYAFCKLCHCHYQDEKHTLCCLGGRAYA